MAREPDDLLTLLRRSGPMAGGDLARALGISPATLSRTYARYQDQVCRMGKTRGVRYALRREVRGLTAPIPVYAVDTKGKAVQVGELDPLVNGQHWFEPAKAEHGPGILYEGLPPYCVDMAPQGFLGRGFVAQHSELELPERLNDWTDDHRLIAIAKHGDDCTGNLVVGRESMDLFLASKAPVGKPSYTVLADAAAAGNAGSSAGGEQPKFAAYNGQHHVIVKFTPGDDSPADVRWRDLLICEAVAAKYVWAGTGLMTECQWLEEGNRRFLESVRFDRVGARGRRGVLSLAAVADEWLGTRDNWIEASRRMLNARMTSEEAATKIRWLEAFGRLIGNNDRHFGNITFYCDETRPTPSLELAPAYDMLPMRYAPTAAGVPALASELPQQTADLLDVWSPAAIAARNFWEEIESIPEVSRGFRELAGGLVQALNQNAHDHTDTSPSP